MSRIDLHSHKALTFETKERAERHAFEVGFAALPHERRAGEWILVFWNESMGVMCALLPEFMCCALPDW